ncbi:MAG TPA: hypothetical protein VLJ42_03995 [Solirubrobacteraceae bacterium]|nr:hypothetical protein [Solirubrobacteraceae bacterium]
MTAVFPTTPQQAGMYESFYLRAVSPDEPVSVWIRYTVHKRRGQAPRGSVWCTVFDAARGRPFQHKLTSDELHAPADGWVAVGDSRIAPGLAEGACGEARWSLRFASDEPELRYLPREWMYRAPLPRTKLTSPAPAACFDGTLELPDRTLELNGWPGMVGHNWGSEHAERWIWMHGIGFDDAPGTWLDVALGRVRVAGRLTPWIANGVLSLDGRRERLGGFGVRGLRVHETAAGAELSLPGRSGLLVQARVSIPGPTAAGWRYANPDGSEHDVINCSIAQLRLTVRRRGDEQRVFESPHGAVYELGMHERDHGVPVAPFSDG